MDVTKRKRLEDAGFKVGDAAEFLGLDDAETLYVELKTSLAETLQKARTDRRLTQDEVATAIGSSQSRVAKMEAGDPSVSVDLLVRSLFIVGASPKDVARVFARIGPRRAMRKKPPAKSATRTRASVSKRNLDRAHP